MFISITNLFHSPHFLPKFNGVSTPLLSHLSIPIISLQGNALPCSTINPLTIMFNIFTKFKERQKLTSETNIQQEALSRIKVRDFNSQLYISFDRIPLIPINKDWTQETIFEELNKLRTSFITYQKQMSS